MKLRFSPHFASRVVVFALILCGGIGFWWSLRTIRSEKHLTQVSKYRTSVFEAVIADLLDREAANKKFVGSKAMVLSSWNEGDSLGFDFDPDSDEFAISDELFKALQSASESKDPFPPSDVFGSNTVLTSDRPLNFYAYFDDAVEPVQAKCFVSFWRPGYSKDRKQAIVRALYGPDHNALVATYLLSAFESGWKIENSILHIYP